MRFAAATAVVLRRGAAWLGGCVAGSLVAALPELWVLDPKGLTPPGQALAASVQGLANRDALRVWVRGAGFHRILLLGLTNRFVLRETSDPWELLAAQRAHVQGFITGRVGDESLNVATTLAGQRDAVIVDESWRDRALAAGWKELGDARETTAEARSGFVGGAARGILVHQPAAKALHLRDFAVQRRAYTCFDIPAEERVRRVAELGPFTEVFGWGTDEHDFVKQVSQGGGQVIPSDWALNLSALGWLPAAPADPVRLPSRPVPTPVRKGERIVAFVVSDGDNVQWLLGGFPEATGFWASPERGKFPVTWEMPPRLPALAPAAWAWLCRTATSQDAFIAGPSGAGYHFPHFEPDAAGLMGSSAGTVAAAGLRAVSVLNSGGGPEEAAPWLAQPGIVGLLYKDYAPYHRRRGAVTWWHGKPCAAFRYLLWEEKRPDGTLRPDWLPEGVAQAIAKQSDDPEHSTDAFALIQVHAWSFRGQGGPLGAVRQTLDRLPAGCRVVTVEEFLQLLPR
jgi:hypothetical protein